MVGEIRSYLARYCLALVVGALLLGGCGTASQTSQHATVAGSQSLDTPTFYRTADGRLAVDGPTVVGSPGEGLNVAASVYQLFLALGIPTEVQCVQIAVQSNAAVVGARSGAGTQLQIAFPEGLSRDQEVEVRRFLSLLHRQYRPL
jgi:hypothetical protein